MNHIRPTVVCGREKAVTKTAFPKVIRLCTKKIMLSRHVRCVHMQTNGKTETKQYIITA